MNWGIMFSWGQVFLGQAQMKATCREGTLDCQEQGKSRSQINLSLHNFLPSLVWLNTVCSTDYNISPLPSKSAKHKTANTWTLMDNKSFEIRPGIRHETAPLWLTEALITPSDLLPPLTQQSNSHFGALTLLLPGLFSSLTWRCWYGEGATSKPWTPYALLLTHCANHKPCKTPVLISGSYLTFRCLDLFL